VTDGRALAREYLEQQRLLGGDAVILAAGRPDGPTAKPPVALAAAAAPTAAIPAVGPSGLPAVGISFDPPSSDLFAADPIQQTRTLADVAALIAPCVRCKLCEGRTRTVPGEGPDTAQLLVVGEGPGKTEDETGRPFVGRAGELLTKILGAIELPREQVYICNVVKCRPPENRLPQYDEIAACVPYLYRQIELVRPKVILAMGGTAAQTLLNTKQSLGSLRNLVHRFRGIPLIVTYHPAALLRNPNWKRPTWDDIRIARRLLDG
jgi:uracil-DNA glycosylase family 4